MEHRFKVHALTSCRYRLDEKALRSMGLGEVVTSTLQLTCNQ